MGFLVNVRELEIVASEEKPPRGHLSWVLYENGTWKKGWMGCEGSPLLWQGKGLWRVLDWEMKSSTSFLADCLGQARL